MDTPLDEERVLKYCYEMSRGQSFPCPVITEGGIILAGNQRANAAVRAGRTTIDAYVVRCCSEEQMDDFVRRDNTRHGKPNSDEDNIHTCVWLHRKHKIPLKELCARYFGGSEKMYGRIVNANMAKTVEARLLARHIQAKLPLSTLVVMHPVADDNVLCDAYRLAYDYNMPIGQVDEMVSAICKKGSEPERQSVVLEKKAELEARVKTGVVKTDVVLMKLDSAGNVVVSRALGAASKASGYAIAVDADGRVAVAGSVVGAGVGSVVGSSAAALCERWNGARSGSPDRPADPGS
jgi:hypothetical protein